MKPTTKPTYNEGGVKKTLGVVILLQREIEKGLHYKVDVGGDAAHLESGGAAHTAQIRHKRNFLRSGGITKLNFKLRNIEILICPAAGLKYQGHESFRPLFRNLGVGIGQMGSGQSVGSRCKSRN